MPDCPRVLVPFIPEEAMWIHTAAETAGVKCSTMRLWCATYGLGRRIGRPWRVSRVALAMHMDGDAAALNAYQAGDRTTEIDVGYYKRLGLSHLLTEGTGRNRPVAHAK